MMTSIGDKIRALRIAKGWSQAELGRRTGISGRHILTLEKHPTMRPHLKNLQKIACVLGVTPNDLLPLEVPEEPSSFGKRVQQLRIQRGWSAQELADKLNVTLRAIHLREQRTKPPRYSTIVAFATIFGVEADQLYRYPSESH